MIHDTRAIRIIRLNPRAFYFTPSAARAATNHYVRMHTQKTAPPATRYTGFCGGPVGVILIEIMLNAS